MTNPLWTTAVRLAQALTDRQTSGWRWERRPLTCPAWCAKDHRCTAQHGYPSGEHRSEPMTWTTSYGAIIATAVQHTNGTARLELRTTVRLDPTTATTAARTVPAGIDLMIRAILATNHSPTRAAVTAR